MPSAALTCACLPPLAVAYAGAAAAAAAATQAAAAAKGSQQQQRRAWPVVKQQELLGATFDQLLKDVKQQHVLQSAQGEDTDTMYLLDMLPACLRVAV
jgi:membrane-bound lytic murein transglycosylase B